ncbi:hypothetical protein MOV66_04465 [Agrobacterium sp. SHOUNA12C]|nr:hypothetical protein [Agrobacterium sp. BETTINA12B]MCJ9755885.1 hypothetical protein [Agrobacterium sp. SHOUNA12C]
MTSAFAGLWQWLRGGLLVVVGAAVGWFSNQYMDYRSAYKDSLSANYQQFNDAASQIEDSLKLFADIARGAKPKTEDDVTQLQSRLLKAASAADDLQRRLGPKSNVVDGYRSAIVELKHASDIVTGPANAKPLVLAVNDYLVAEKQLRDVVVAEHTAFLF